MKFGQVDSVNGIDLTLPADHPATEEALERMTDEGRSSDEVEREIPLQIHVGCAKWNRKDLKNFYPRGTRDELAYYATQFNAVEMNATFYRYFSESQVRDWSDKVPAGFRFFPKIHQDVSHRKWLNDIESPVNGFIESVSHFEEKLGTVFLQMRDKFAPKFMDRLISFLEIWPDGLPLAVELRHPDWFGDSAVADELYDLLDRHRVANVLVDTAGRRDLLHMRLTGRREAFIRYVGANDKTDYDRLDEWVERLESWVGQGLRRIHFFVHQNDEVASPALSAHFIRKLNKALGVNLHVPELPDGTQSGLF